MTSPLPPDDIELLQTSLARILPQAPAATRRFYGRLFELAPETQQLFTHDMEEQGRKFMETLAYLVNGLYNIDRIRPAIERLGRDHVEYGVQPDHYWAVRDALLWAMAETEGVTFTDEVGAAWARAYDLLASIMQKAAADQHDAPAE